MTRIEQVEGALDGIRIAVWHNLPSGGGLRALVAQVAAFRGAGAHVEVFCPPSAERNFFRLPAAVRQHVVPLVEPVVRTVRGDVTREHRQRRAELAAMHAHGQAVAELMERGGFDMVFSGSCQRYRTSPVAQYTALPSLLYLQEPYRWLYEALPTLPWVELGRPTENGAWRKRLTEWGRLLAYREQAADERSWAFAHDRVLVNSHFSRESVLRAYGLDATVCYLGIDEPPAQVLPDTRGEYVLSVGALIAEKSPQLLLEAVAQLDPGRRRLVWVANHVDNGIRALAEHRATELGIELVIEHAISDKQLERHFRTARVMLYAPRLEPFGLAPLEAMARGLPVVAVPEAGVRETVVDTVSGRLAAPEPWALARAVDAMWPDSQERQALVESAKLFVESHFNQRGAADRLVHEVRSLLSTVST